MDGSRERLIEERERRGSKEAEKHRGLRTVVRVEKRVWVYGGFSDYSSLSLYVAVVRVRERTDVWSVDYEHNPDSSTKPSPHGLAELRRYYREVHDYQPTLIATYRQCGK
jgi:hypothetical protein